MGQFKVNPKDLLFILKEQLNYGNCANWSATGT